MRNFFRFFLVIILVAVGNAGETSFLPGQEKYISTSDFEEEIVTYPEIWTINGKNIYTQGTWIVARFMFSVRILYKGNPIAEDRDYASKIAKYAVENGYRKNAAMLNNFHDSYIIGNTIAVSLLSCDKDYIPNGKMYNYTFQMNELFDKTYQEPEISHSYDFNKLSEEYSKGLIEAINKGNVYVIENIWNNEDKDKFKIFSDSLVTLKNYVSSATVIEPVSLIYSGTLKNSRIFRIYLSIENPENSELFAAVEVIMGEKPHIRSVKFIIF